MFDSYCVYVHVCRLLKCLPTYLFTIAYVHKRQDLFFDKKEYVDVKHITTC